MINYYDIVVNTARMIGNCKATKKEIEKLAKRIFGYTGREFNEIAFSQAYSEFRVSGRKNDYLIFA
ncbi:MAG: hypothetical protein PHO27_12955 [Sulfuricurvum sp.]|nr:hypothetical protein [Sulfuricurvum sp.]